MQAKPNTVGSHRMLLRRTTLGTSPRELNPECEEEEKEQEEKCGKKKARIGDAPGGRTSYNAPGGGALVASLVSFASFFDPALRETKKASVDLAGCSKVRGRQRARPGRGKPRAHCAHEQGGG